MRILGIDPGLSVMGFGVVDYHDGRMRFIDAGQTTTSGADAMGVRLLTLYGAVAELLRVHAPAVLALERQIYCQNVRTAMTLGQTQGIIALAAAQHEVPVWEVSPRELKQALLGVGQAAKSQVARSVARLLNIDVAAISEHAADALAAALAYTNRSALEKRLAAAGVSVSRRRL